MKKEHVVIVGGGILGASAAFHLTNLGAKVTIIDRDDLGKATNVAAGIICPWLSQRRNKAWYYLAHNGALYYRKLIEELKNGGELHTGYEQTGVLNIHHEEKRIDKIIEIANKRKESAPEIGEIEKLHPEQVAERWPFLKAPLYGAFMMRGAKVNGLELCQSLLRAAIKKGATFKKGAAAIKVTGNELTGVSVDGEFLQAEKVIVTTGAWGKEIFEPLGLQFNIEPQKAQLLDLQLNDDDTSNWPVIMAPSALYMMTSESGELLAGTTHENHVGFDINPTVEAFNEIVSKTMNVAPIVQKSKLKNQRVGFRPVAPNFLPILGEVPGYKRMYVANGLGSSGLTAGPFLGKQLAQLVLGMEVEIDLNLYQVNQAFGHEKG
ncbi:NAD(P)/FAD-dependent oxidoreductase [Alkalihalobacillus trypoxylicola]|uniref:NAD(P)/FAD-dependent oxidoreductase n=1 Tax=Alkalihalobacillus trypoxylicola TaxID=519424 RepID=UPI000AAC6B39|nr:FAD-dependent oxidoreductase [Alkalihalobacillus trypoxylicola]